MTDIATDSVQPGVEPIINSQAQGAAEPVAGEDLEGIKKNRDDILAEKKQVSADLKKANAELEKIKKSQAESEKKALLEQEKFKDLYEMGKVENEKIQATIAESEKKSNFKDAAMLAGIQPKFLKFVMAEMSQVEFDETGNPTNAGAFFVGFKELYPQFFNPENGAVPIPKTDSAKTNLTGTQQKPITPAWIKSMQPKIPNMTPDEYRDFRNKIDTAREAGQIQ
jgi:hypothetical protein